MKTGTHEFALYTRELLTHTSHKPGSRFTIPDGDLYHRIKQVLRLEPGQTCTLFNMQQHGLVKIIAIDKKKIEAELLSLETNKALTPHITCLIPVLKRDALAEAIYTATEVGANNIQLVTTEKIHRKWDGTKELERLERVVIAAAEQAKHYALPTLLPPISLADAVTQLNPHAVRLFCDPAGQPFLPLLNKLANPATNNLVLLIGPEGDLVETEKALLSQRLFIFCALTPTILRAPQAVAVALGVLRTCL